MQWPSYLPYPIAFIRALFQITAIATAASLLVGSNDLEEFLPLLILSPFGLVTFLLIPIVMMVGFHWIFRNILHQMKGVSKPRIIESLWEGIYGWMVAIFSCTMTMLVFVLPAFLTTELPAIYDQYDNWYWGYYIDDDGFLLSCLIIYSVITLYLYQLEHLIRFPGAKTSPKRPPKNQQPSVQTKNSATTRIQKPRTASKKSAVNVTPDEIELELQRLKKKQRKP